MISCKPSYQNFQYELQKDVLRSSNEVDRKSTEEEKPSKKLR